MQPQTFSSKLTAIHADRARLIPILRPLHALLTAVPDLGAPMKCTTPLRLLAQDMMWLLAFTMASVAGAALGSLGGFWIAPATLLIIFGMLGATGRMRRLIVGHVHEATHGIVAKFYRARGDSKRQARRKAEFILDFGTALTFTQNGQSYRREHNRHHRLGMLGTLNDPDGKVLHDWGVWPTRTNNLYLALAGHLFNPLWHAQVFWMRAKSNLAEGKLYRRAVGFISLAILLGSALVLPMPIWLVAVALPFGPLLNAAGLMQVVTEHPYGGRPATDLESYAALTWERIPWTPMPKAAITERPVEWAKWSNKLVVHIAARLAILDDTMVGHGWHHLAWPSGRPFTDWWNTMARYVEAGQANEVPEGADDRIVEGLIEALARQCIHFALLRR